MEAPDATTLATRRNAVKLAGLGYSGRATIARNGLRMSEVSIWHDPHYSKFRETLRPLQSGYGKNHAAEFPKTPPSEPEIECILTLQSRALMRRTDNAHREHALNNPTLIRARLAAASHNDPPLIQSPALFADGIARIGRPPERVFDTL
ncbi:MAG: ArsC/Spx/MgsR family protein [Gammaproteobacteria bacterium]